MIEENEDIHDNIGIFLETPPFQQNSEWVSFVGWNFSCCRRALRNEKQPLVLLTMVSITHVMWAWFRNRVVED